MIKFTIFADITFIIIIMVHITLIIFALLALSMDYYILRRYVARTKPLRILYIAQALLLDVCALMYLASSFYIVTAHSHATTMAILWLMLVFISTFGSKLIFTLFSLVELVVWRICGRHLPVITRLGLGVVIIFLAAVVYSAAYKTHQIRVERVTITDSRLGGAFDGFTIAQFSDAHLGNLGSDRLIRDLVERINELNPSIVVQTGDIVNIHSGELDHNFMQLFSQLQAPVFSVLGNHDMGYYIHDQRIDPEQSVRDLMAKQQLMGWKLLRNENVWIKRRTHNGFDSIAICGVAYPEDGRFGVRRSIYGGSDLRRTFEDVDSSFSILLSHSPALYDSLPGLGLSPAITISGHIHAMQAKLTIGDCAFSPASWLYDKWSGLYKEGDRALYINDGLGYVLYPLRVGTRPEITLYTLNQD